MSSKQNGSTLVVSLIILTIITLVVIYSLEDTNIQAKMVANSIHTKNVFIEGKNTLYSGTRYYGPSTNRSDILEVKTEGVLFANDVRLPTEARKADEIRVNWEYKSELNAENTGENIDIGSQTKNYLYEQHAFVEHKFARSSQTMGVSVKGLFPQGHIASDE